MCHSTIDAAVRLSITPRGCPNALMIPLRIDEIAAVEVGSGCIRRDLPSLPNVRAWVVDMAPHSRWPHIDVHDAGEGVFVVSGELIEGDHVYGPGAYLHFAPGSRHQPRTETGVRLFGFNPVSR